jgi:hypothetical protein
MVHWRDRVLTSVRKIVVVHELTHIKQILNNLLEHLVDWSVLGCSASENKRS